MAMNEVCEKAGAFLQSVFDGTDLRLQVSATGNDGECVLDVDGPDAELLQSEGGELLEAMQHLVNQVFGRTLPPGQRLVCDVHGFRATREAELRAMAQHAAERVRATGTDFMFGPMNANERRIIHLTLANSEDLLTESVGQGSDRKLKIARRPVA
jgi:spoIIIJ-associated protein